MVFPIFPRCVVRNHSTTTIPNLEIIGPHQVVYVATELVDVSLPDMGKKKPPQSKKNGDVRYHLVMTNIAMENHHADKR